MCYGVCMTANAETGEVLVAEVTTLEQANAVRCDILSRFDHVWLLVMLNHETTKYEVFAANEWCGRLSEARIEDIKNACSTVVLRFEEPAMEVTEEDFVAEDAPLAGAVTVGA